MRIVRELLAALTMIIIGQLMEIDPKNYLYVLMVNPIITLFLHILRRIKETREDRYVEDCKENL